MAGKASSAAFSGARRDTTIPTRNDSGMVTRPGFQGKERLGAAQHVHLDGG